MVSFVALSDFNCSDFKLSGNGTQSLVWQINEETYRQTLESEASENPNPPTPGLQIFYGSLHDVLSYPCEVSFFCRSMTPLNSSTNRMAMPPWYRLHLSRSMDPMVNISKMFICSRTIPMTTSGRDCILDTIHDSFKKPRHSLEIQSKTMS